MASASIPLPTDPRFIDLTGRVFGRLTVVGYAGKVKGKTSWNCRCICGKGVVAKGNGLQQGDTRSCGCLHDDAARERLTTHGKCKTAEYRSWCAMLSRCTDPNSKVFSDYGGRGITVCERWREFENFLEDLGEKPTPNHSIDRVNNNGDYEPTNCRWATRTQQARNRRARKSKLWFTGIQFKKGGYEARIQTNGKRLCLGTFSTLEEAATVRKEAELKYWRETNE